MALLTERGFERRIVETSRGRLEAYALAPEIFVTVVTGHMETPHADEFVAYGDSRLVARRGKKLRIFHDWTAMTGYESSCRQQLTTWSAKHLGEMAEVHMALRSKIVAMGVQVANLALGGMIRAHTNLADVEVALAATMASVSKAS